MDLLPVYIILGSLFLVGILAITGILVFYYGKHYFKPQSNGVVQVSSTFWLWIGSQCQSSSYIQHV